MRLKHFILACAALSCGAQPANASYRVLANIPAVLDGQVPIENLIQVGGLLYGVTSSGGAYGGIYGGGGVFSLDPNSGAEKILYSFGADAPLSNGPSSGLLYFGGLLYGMAFAHSGGGEVYALNPATGSVSTVVTFSETNGLTSNSDANDTLSTDGTLIYGVTCLGGSGATPHGVAFSYNPSTGMQTILHNFGAVGDISCPAGPVVNVGGTLYGTGGSGGPTGYGGIFAINLATHSETVAYGFNPSTGDPAGALSGLVAVGNLLYGTGSAKYVVNGTGGVFSFDPSTGAEVMVHQSGSQVGNCSTIANTLAVANTVLYGVAGGCNSASGLDALFSLDTTNGAFAPIGGLPQLQFIAQQPSGTVFVSGSNLYGVRPYGAPDATSVPVPGLEGDVFRLNLASSQFTSLHQFIQPPLPGSGSGSNFSSILVPAGKLFYGTSSIAGNFNRGVLYSVTPAGVLTVLHSFTGGGDGGNPVTEVYNLNGVLYGTTEFGGANGAGTIFSYNIASGTFSTAYSFAGGASDGAAPEGALVAVGNLLYGTTNTGGANGLGTFFSFNPTSGAEAVLYAFTGGTDSGSPVGALTNLNGTVYGTAQEYNLRNAGSLYSFNTSTGVFSVLHQFAGADGRYPLGGLLALNGILYGTTSISEASPCCGTIFDFNPATGAEGVVFQFTGKKAFPFYGPNSPLVASGATIYGTANSSISGFGGIFGVTNGIAKKYHYFGQSAPDGNNPTAGLTPDGKSFLGTTAVGAEAGSSGVVFLFKP